MLSVNPHPPTRGREKEEKGERHFIEYKISFINNTNDTNNINNKRNKTKCTKPILSFRELGAGRWHPASSCWAAPGSPGLALAAIGRNWTQECTDQNLEQDRRKDNEQGPLQKTAMDKESENLAISSFKLSMMCMAWNTSLVSIGSPVLSTPPCKCNPLRLLTFRT